MNLRIASAFRLLLVAFGIVALVACGGRQPGADALADARAAIDDAAWTERCAETEYRAARGLLQQAEEAAAAGNRDRARVLAEAARNQAEVARRAAEANAEDCERAQRAPADDPNAGRTPVAPDTSAASSDANYTLEPIYFPFNESGLTEQARAILDRHAAWLNRNPSIRLLIEGHCDERGSTEYNLALGENRARAVRAYLQRLGVDVSRLQTVSYGHEMPASSNDDLNRRAEFRIR